MSPVLREIADSDIAIFYEHQLDPEAIAMVGHAGEPRPDRESYDAKWAANRKNPVIVVRTVLSGDRVAGYVTCFERASEASEEGERAGRPKADQARINRFGVREVGYWIGREYWGQGLATAALRELLVIVTARPLAARVAKHNAGSRRVVEKCGFVITGEDRYTPVPGGPEIPEWVLTLA